jgi:hypothetical protein
MGVPKSGMKLLLGVPVYSRASNAHPTSGISAWLSGSVLPATWSCQSTRSRRVITSVPGCSTWSRVFLSGRQTVVGNKSRWPTNIPKKEKFSVSLWKMSSTVPAPT